MKSLILRLQNIRVSFFLKIAKAWRKSPTRAKRASPSLPVGRVGRIFSVSPSPSLALRFQPRSRPFVCLLART